MIDISDQTKPMNENSGQAEVGSSWTLSEIAELSQADIRRMSCEELISVIRAADIPLLREKMIEHLPHCDHATLLQLAFLAQHTIRNLGY